MSRRLIGPSTFADLTERDQLLWKRFFGRHGIDWQQVSEFEIVEDPPAVVVRFIEERISERIPVERERKLRAGFLERRLLQRAAVRGVPML